MADIINLRSARKRLARDDRAAAAAVNRAKHGLTKAERRRTEADAAHVSRVLDGARREPD